MFQQIAACAVLFSFLCGCTRQPAEPQFTPGLGVTVQFDSDAPQVLAVPNSALAEGKVTVISANGKQEQRKVETGESNGTLTEIKSGLKEGEQVLSKAKS